MLKAVQYGAGVIGRGFMGRLLGESGYAVTFVDVNPVIVDRLNADSRYPVRSVSNAETKEIIIENVNALIGSDTGAVARAIADCDLLSTSVGVNVLPHIIPVLVEAVRLRWQQKPHLPLNIIFAENLIDADTRIPKMFGEYMDAVEMQRLRETVGFVRASIGCMVPEVSEDKQEGNPLRVWVEPYLNLPVDKDGFKGDLPPIKNLSPFSPFDYMIRRKLFVHNLGHAITSYNGQYRGCEFMADAAEIPEVRRLARGAMTESAQALSKHYHMPMEPLKEHIEDLIFRFANRAIYAPTERIGRDTWRKLGPQDRFVGAAKFSLENGVPCPFTCAGIAAALYYAVHSSTGAEQKTRDLIQTAGVKDALAQIAQLPPDHSILHDAMEFYRRYEQGTELADILEMAESFYQI